MMQQAKGTAYGVLFRTAVLYALAGPLLISGCSGSPSNDLTRERAKAIIAQAGPFPFERKMRLPFAMKMDNPMALRTMDILGQLQRAGFITTTKLKQALYEPFSTYRITLTESGRKFAEPADPATTQNEAILTVCQMDVGSVTGIETSADKRKADVHFNMVIKEVSPFALLDDGRVENQTLTHPNPFAGKLQRCRSLMTAGE